MANDVASSMVKTLPDVRISEVKPLKRETPKSACAKGLIPTVACLKINASEKVVLVPFARKFAGTGS
jgi:hypothetical protein